MRCGCTFEIPIDNAVHSSTPVDENARLIDQRLAELDEEIDEVSAEIEAIRGSEKARPLQLGCAVFGLFSLALLVIGFFMTIGADYFGRWPFYLSLAVVLALGLLRAGRKFSQAEQLEKLRRQKSQLEQVLASAETERDRLLDLRRQVTGEAPQRES
jgi:hypothetical protein